jgi:hypothetical protein
MGTAIPFDSREFVLPFVLHQVFRRSSRAGVSVHCCQFVAYVLRMAVSCSHTQTSAYWDLHMGNDLLIQVKSNLLALNN